MVKKPSNNKLLEVNTQQTYAGFTIITDSVKILKAKGRTSYIFRVKLSSPRASAFQNLTIDESAEGTRVFVNTYIPSKKWIANWRTGKTEKFEGDIDVVYLNTGLPVNTTATSKTSTTNTIMRAVPSEEDCTTTTYYERLAYYCGSGQHGPGDSGCYLTGGDADGYYIFDYTVTNCNGGGGGGGGGSTTPNPDPGFNPCDSGNPDPGLGVASFNKKSTGNKVMIAAPPTDCDSQSPVLPEEELDPLEPLQAYNKLCSSSFNFQTVVASGDGSRGWKEASVAGLTINVMSSGYFENIWNVLTTGSGSTIGTFNLTIGAPGDLPSANISKEACFAVNKAMIDIYRSYGASGVKSLINTGQIGNKIAALAQIQLASIIPEARVSGSLSNRVTATSPIINVNCQ